MYVSTHSLEFFKQKAFFSRSFNSLNNKISRHNSGLFCVSDILRYYVDRESQYLTHLQEQTSDQSFTKPVSFVIFQEEYS